MGLFELLGTVAGDMKTGMSRDYENARHTAMRKLADEYNNSDDKARRKQIREKREEIANRRNPFDF